MKRYEMTLDEAQKAIQASPINSMNPKNPILMRELAWIGAAVACDDYPSRQFRESVNTVFEIQRAGRPFYYGATPGRVALIEEEDPRVIRWHDAARGKVFTNEHPIDLRDVFMGMRARAKELSHEDIYHVIARFVFFVGAATTEGLRGYKTESWDGEELFVRFRERGIRYLYLFPGTLARVGRDWIVE